MLFKIQILCYLTNSVETCISTCYMHVSRYWWGDRNMPSSGYLLNDRNMVLPCFKIHGVVMFWGIETSTMAPTENLRMEKNKWNLGRRECEKQREWIYWTWVFNLKWCWNTNDGKFQTRMYVFETYIWNEGWSKWLMWLWMHMLKI